jgi:response regulator RpfG family c-di-GMP phosphodiesterase
MSGSAVATSRLRLVVPMKESKRHCGRSKGTMSHRILFVDDEFAVLEGYKRSLHREFEVDSAVGGAEGLTLLRKRGPYAVVISDMRMPEMNGAQFLAQVRQEAPDTVRMLLTGYADITAAIAAVNEGNIFRFLSKPCEKDVLLQALAAGVQQYELIHSERELLEKTLLGSIRVLNDVLSASCPEAFARSLRITRCVEQMMREFKVVMPWRFEAAATLSQLGCVALDTELVQKAYTGAKLSAEEQARFDGHPARGMQLLAHIPRVEPVAWMIAQQLKPAIASAGEIATLFAGMSVTEAREIELGARMLKIAVAYEELRMRLASEEFVLVRLRGRSEEFGLDLVDALSAMGRERRHKELRLVATAKLEVGMVLDQEIRNRQGMLVVGLLKLQNFAEARTIERDVRALVTI